MGVGMLRLEGTKEHSIIMYFDASGNELGYVEIPNDSIGSNISQNYMCDIEKINDSLYIGLASFGINNTVFFIGTMMFDNAGRIHKKEYGLDGSGLGKLIKTFDKKYIVGTDLIESKTDWDIYMYKINEELEQDTLYPGNYTYDSLCPYPIKSGNIDISDCMVVTDVGESPDLEEYLLNKQTIGILARPNPSNTGEVLLELENTESFNNMELQVFDVYGKQIHCEKVWPHQGASRHDVNIWKAGMYVAVVYGDGVIKGRCKFMVE